MAKNVIIDLKIDTKDGEKSIGKINEEGQRVLSTMREMEQASEAITQKLKDTAVGTEEYKKLSQELIKVNTELKNQELALEALDSEQVASELKSVAGGFADMAGGMALVGAGSAGLEELVRTIAKVEGATKILTGGMEAFHSAMKLQNNIALKLAAVQGKLAKASKGTGIAAKAAAVGQKILNAAMNANPIFLIVTALAAVVAGYAAFIAFSGKAATSQEVMNDAQDAAVEKAADELNALDMLKVKLSDNTLTREEQVDAIKSLQEEYPGLLENTDAEADSMEKVNAAIEDYNELVLLRAEADALAEARAESFKAKIEAQTNAQTGNNQSWTSWIASMTSATMAQAIHNGEQAEAIKESEAEIKVLDDLTKGIEDKIAAKEKELGIDRKAREEAKKKEDAEKQAEKDAKKAADKAAARARKARALAIKIAQEIAKAKVAAELKMHETLDELAAAQEEITTSAHQAEINAVTDKYFRLRELAAQNIKDEQERAAAIAIFQAAEDKQVTALINKRTQAAVNAAQERQAILANEVLAQIQHEKEIELLKAGEIEDVIEREKKIADIKNKYKAKEIDAINAASSKQNALLDAQMADELLNAELTAEQKLLIEAKYQAQKEQLARDTEMKIQEMQAEAVLTSDELQAAAFQEKMGKISEWFDAIGGMITQTMDLVSQALDMQAEKDAAKREEEFNAESDALQASLNNREISQKEFDAKMQRLEQKKADKEKAARHKAFKQEKAMAIVSAVMGTAQAVIAGLQAGFPLGIVMAALAGVLGAVQIGIIASQKFKGNRGGVVPGGASKVDTVDAKLAPGEAVINSESSMMFPQLLSQINQAGGGIPLAPEPVPTLTSGGGGDVFNPGGNQTLKAYVVESEMTNSQSRVSRMERSAEF